MIVILIFTSLLLQQFQIDIGLSSIKPFMIMGIVLFFMNLKQIKISPLVPFEILWILLYIILILTSNYTENKLLAFKFDLGVIIILFTYFVFRSLLENITINKFEYYFYQVGKYYILISIILYIGGLILYYINGIHVENEHHLLGMYRQGIIPRLCGLGESPNNYILYATVFLYYFWNKKKLLLFWITLFSLFLTFSTTVYFSLLIGFFILAFYQKKLLLFIFSTIIVLAGLYILYLSVDSIHAILTSRIERNATGSGRIEVWAYVLDLISQHPLFGYGTNQSRELIAPLRALNSTHNTFLEVWISSGIMGVIPYLTLLLVILFSSIRYSLHFRNLFLILIFINYFIVSMANNLLLIDYNIFYFLILWFYISKTEARQHKKEII